MTRAAPSAPLSFGRRVSGAPVGVRLGLPRCSRPRGADWLQLTGHRVGLEQSHEIQIRWGGALIALATQKHAVFPFPP